MIVYINLESRVPIHAYPDPSRVKAPANYKNPDIIQKYQIEHAMTTWRALAVDPTAGQVFCITYMVEGDETPTVLMHADEEALLKAFQEYIPQLIDRAQGQPLIWVTFNGLKFDFQFLFNRAVRYGLGLLARQMQAKRWGDYCHIDVFQILGGECTLDEWCDFFGIVLDNPISGAQISEALIKQQHDEIVRHTISRVVGCRGIYLKLKEAGVV